jgi:hypothetical protein
MRKTKSLCALGLMLCAVLACRTLRDIAEGPKLFEGSNMEKAATAFKEKIGSSPVVALKLVVTNESAILHVRNPQQADKVDKYEYVKGICSGPKPAALDGTELLGNWDKYSFPLDDVNFAAMPDVVKGALARTEVREGKVEKITIRKDFLYRLEDSDKIPAVNWDVKIGGYNESAEVFANAHGDIVFVDLSDMPQAEKQNYHDPKALQDAVKEIKRTFHDQVYFANFTVDQKRISFLAATSPTSDELIHYVYNLNGVTRNEFGLGPSGDEPPRGQKPHKFLFRIDEIDLSKTSQVISIAMSKAGGEDDPVLGSMTLQRERIWPTEAAGPIEWEVTVRLGALKTASIYFDAQGNFRKKAKDDG